MLLVIESREDTLPIPAETAPRSTERALRHMDWPFPVDDAVPTPRRPLPLRAASNVVTLRPAPAEPRRIAARVAAPVPRFLPVLAEAN